MRGDSGISPMHAMGSADGQACLGLMSSRQISLEHTERRGTGSTGGTGGTGSTFYAGDKKEEEDNTMKLT